MRKKVLYPIVGILIGAFLGLIIGQIIDASNANRGKYGVIKDSEGKLIAQIIYGDRKPVTLNLIIGCAFLGLFVGTLASRKKSKNNIAKTKSITNDDSTINNNKIDKIDQWTYQKIAEFLDGVKEGKILPAASKHTFSDNKPLTIFSFPQYNCEIHVHWKDKERENLAVAHIKDMVSGKRITRNVDTYTIAMLRHFSGIDNN